MIAENLKVARPPLAFRVGVTGARDLSSAPVETLRRQVGALFQLLTEELKRAAAANAQAYATRPDGKPFGLRLVSPLAEGADRLVAEVAETFGADLYAPLPFARDEYEQDFPDSIADFRAKLETAQVLELDGAHTAANDSYLEVGQYVVRNCDLLIAVWDGKKANGVGGTGDIVAFAAQTDTIVWLIDLAGGTPHLIEGAAALRQRKGQPAGESAEVALRSRLREKLAPPPPPPRTKGGVLKFLAELWRRASADEASPLEDFYAERPRKKRVFWRAFAWFMNFLAPGPDEQDDKMPPQDSAAKEWWRELYETADYYSLAYADRYRSSYLLVALLAVIGLTLGSFVGEFSALRAWAAWAEIVPILLIGGLVIFNQRRRWHERWISYRMLAELCRKQFVLSGLGRSLPARDVNRLAAEAYESGDAERLPPEAWVAWYYDAELRAAPPLVGDMRRLEREALAEARELVARQLRYHTGRHDRNDKAGERLVAFGDVSFVLTACVVAVKFFFSMQGREDVAHWIVAVGVVVSATSAAFVGIRAYAEFSLLARQSAHMALLLKEAAAELDAIDLDEPLASRELGRCLFSLAATMMQDMVNWAQLFRVKALEAQ